MAKYHVTVSVRKDYAARLDKRWLKSVVGAALDHEKVEAPAEVSLLVMDDETVRRLNRDYRQVDRITDVLAFALTEDGGPFVTPPDGVARLGEVVVSYPQAARQAERAKHSIKAEMALLVVHGVLHLLGYDHAGPTGKRRMWRRQKAILAKLAGTL